MSNLVVFIGAPASGKSHPAVRKECLSRLFRRRVPHFVDDLEIDHFVETDGDYIRGMKHILDRKFRDAVRVHGIDACLTDDVEKRMLDLYWRVRHEKFYDKQSRAEIVKALARGENVTFECTGRVFPTWLTQIASTTRISIVYIQSRTCDLDKLRELNRCRLIKCIREFIRGRRSVHAYTPRTALLHRGDFAKMDRVVARLARQFRVLRVRFPVFV